MESNPKPGDMITVPVYEHTLFKALVPRDVFIEHFHDLYAVLDKFVQSKGYPEDWLEQTKQVKIRKRKHGS